MVWLGYIGKNISVARQAGGSWSTVFLGDANGDWLGSANRIYSFVFDISYTVYKHYCVKSKITYLNNS